MQLIIHSSISSCLDCFNSLCISRTPLQEPLTLTSKRAHIALVLAELHWLPVSLRIHLKIFVAMFTAFHGQGTAYIFVLLDFNSPAQSLRPLNQCPLITPCSHFKAFSQWPPDHCGMICHSLCTGQLVFDLSLCFCPFLLCPFGHFVKPVYERCHLNKVGLY